MRSRSVVLAAALAGATFTSLMGADGGCGPPILDNNGFDLWCGNELCYWEVESGEVARVPTWHESDFGAEFRGSRVVITQLTDIGSSVECLRFRTVANIDLDAIVTVEVDFFDDGTYDVSQRIPTSDWAQVEFELPTPVSYRGARFRVRKEGNGQAILAEVQVTHSDKCIEPRVEVNDRAFGERCNADSQCASGTCCGFVCSSCCPIGGGDADCPGQCELAAAEGSRHVPYMCEGDAESTLEADAFCFRDGQCVSGDCVGEDIFICESTGALCPNGASDCESDDVCVIFGVADGTCQ